MVHTSRLGSAALSSLGHPARGSWMPLIDKAWTFFAQALQDAVGILTGVHLYLQQHVVPGPEQNPSGASRILRIGSMMSTGVRFQSCHAAMDSRHVRTVFNSGSNGRIGRAVGIPPAGSSAPADEVPFTVLA
jgi:hypothetical protein